MHRRTFVKTGAAALGLGARGVRPAWAGGRRPPARPGPSATPLAWQRDELALFVHFGVNTFTDREWGDGSEDPKIFNPTRLDARQWARAARAGGFRTMILTAKHHDGFCLWPSRYTEHSVKSSPWKGGQGDVVREFVDAARAEGLGAGLYLSPWDRHEPSYGDSPRYNDHYVAQLTELLTNYGPLVEVWFDGANGEGPNGKKQVYDWPRIHRTVRTLQPQALMFSDAGPDIRWIGNEKGTAGDPNWCTVDPAAVPAPGVSGPGVTESLQHGNAHGTVWRPGEADVSIRPGWFWHAAQNDRVRSAENLMELYFSSVGRNANLLLNVPPTTEGLFHPTDVSRLAEFGELRRRLLAEDLAAGARASASATADRARAADRVVDGDPDTHWSPSGGPGSGWVELELRRPATFDVVSLQEAIPHGQSVERHTVQAWNGGEWTTLAQGTTIGYRRLHRVPATTTSRLRLSVESSLDAPRIGAVGLYRGAEGGR
jgi:alpha-L-fucosidase